MAKLKRLFCLLGLTCSGAWFSTAAHAECGGLQQCIAVSIDASLPAHGTPEVSAPLAFGDQTAGSTSQSRTIRAGAVEGPAGTRATIDAITLTGPNAGDFSLAGGTCVVGVPTLLHNGTATASLAETCTVNVTFNPATVGAKTANVRIFTTAITRTVPVTGTGTPSLGGPGAGPAVMDVPVNTPTTLDLAPFTSDVVAGIGIVTIPIRGTVTIAGTRVTYTPVKDYFGPDTFTYAAFNAAGSSPPATVTVNVTGRPDPSRDPNVIGLINAQQQSARRFATTQISNFQRRLEGLHQGPDNASGRAAGLVPAPTGGAASANNRSTSFGVGPRVAFGDAPAEVQLASAGLLRTADPPWGLRPAMAPPGTGDFVPPQLVSAALALASTGSLDLASASGRAGGSRGFLDDAGIWIGGNINFGTRDQTPDARGVRFRSDGITIGTDRRFTDKLALGVGIGFARDTTTIGTDGTNSHSEGLSIALYGSYQPTRTTFIDGLMGYGALRHDTERYVPAVNDITRMHRNSDQLFGSIAAGYEFRAQGVLLSPYGRFDFAYDRFKQASETGAGANALTYFEQTQTTVQAALGLRAESRHETSFGYARPRLRAELKHDFAGNRNANIAFADQLAGPVYSLTPPGLNRNSLLLGVGSDFELRNGLKLGVDYQAQRSFGPDRNHSVRLWLRKDFDGKPLPSGLPTAKLFDAPVRVEAGYMWDNNVSRGQDASDRLSDHVYSLALTKSTTIGLGTHTRMLLAGFVNGEKFYTYRGLDHAAIGGRAELQYRTSGEFAAPTFGLFARVLYDEYHSALRTGHRYAYGMSARQSWTDRIDVFAAYTSTVRDANHPVFDARDWSARANIDYSLGRAGVIYLGGEYRRGDIVSTGGPPGGAGYAAYAMSFVQDDAYGGSPRFAYRLQAKTVIWTLGYNRPLGPRDSLDFSWRRAGSTALLPPAPPGFVYSAGLGTPRYTADQFSIAYLMRF